MNAHNRLLSASAAQVPYPTSDDEISLFDLWDILVRYRWRLLAIWALIILAAAAYLAIVQPVYESRAVLRMGQVGGDFITPPAALVLELKERYQVGESGRERPYLKSVKQEGDGALVLEAEAYSPIEAQGFLQQSINELLEQQQQRYIAARNLQESALVAVEEQIAALEDQIQGLAEAADSASVEEAVKALVVLQRSSLQADLPTLQEQRLRLQQSLSQRKSYPSELIREPILPEQASSPRRALTLALALVLGGMLGCMAAFLSEFMHQAKNRQHPLV